MAWVTETGAMDLSAVDTSVRGETTHRPIHGLLAWQPGAQQLQGAAAIKTKGDDPNFMNKWGDELAVPEAVGCGGLEGPELEACLGEAAVYAPGDLDDEAFVSALLVEGCGRGGYVSCGRIFDRLQDAGRACDEAALEVEAIHPNIVCGCPGRECSERVALTPDERRAQQTSDAWAAKTRGFAWMRRKWLGVPAWGWAVGGVAALYWMRR